MSEPELYSPNALERYKEDIGGSYIYDVYNKDDAYQPEVNKEDGGLKYINTLFCRFDNRLAHKELKYYWEE